MSANYLGSTPEISGCNAVKRMLVQKWSVPECVIDLFIDLLQVFGDFLQSGFTDIIECIVENDLHVEDSSFMQLLDVT